MSTTQRMEHRMVRAIAWYQSLRPGHPSPCRFFPTCSEYASEAITTHGPWRGLWLTIRRLSRCRPFGPSGFDPVPEIHGEGWPGRKDWYQAMARTMRCSIR
ncbi:MAG: membrane protein insertion efficiency factor YidD [Actinobacteria bacterium]|nr:membrane protein insertion efficiency factor YidD [Actinomycetota bacterium]